MIEALRRQRWWITRVLVLPVHLLVFTIATFLLIRSIPGDPVLRLLGPQGTKADYARMQEALGLDGSLWSQLIHYIGGLLSFNLGNSISSGRSVVSELSTRFPATLELALQSLACTIVISLVASYFVVMRPRNPFSRAVRAYSRAAGAFPDYVLAVIGVLVFYSILGWAPAPLGRMDPGIVQPETITGFPLLDAIVQGRWDAVGSLSSHLVIPVAVMALGQAALLMKLLISGLEEALDAAPTRFRIASGASRPAIVLSVYRRALPPSVIMCAGIFGALLGGAIVIETLFSFSGLGQYAIAAVNSNDYIALQGVFIVAAATTLLLYLGVDLLNMVIDPRRRPGVRSEE